MNQVAQVILPLPIRSNFDYRVPDDVSFPAEVGKRVLVVFGKSKIYTGVIKKIWETDNADELKKLKFLDDVLDEVPALRPLQMELFEWVAFYYFCTEGEVIKAALPAGMKPESAMRIVGIEGLDFMNMGLGEKELDLLDALEVQPTLTLDEVCKIWGIQNPATRLKNMESRGLLKRNYVLEESYKPKFEKFIQLSEPFHDEEKLKLVFEKLKNAARQEDVLMLVASAHFNQQVTSKKDLLKKLGASASAIKSLVDKGILEEYDVQVDRLEGLTHDHKWKDIVFTQEQSDGLESIRNSFKESPEKPILLHGVTGSGKTHLYIELIKEELAKGKQVLYLLPEIGLTKQIIDKVRTEFGEQVGVYHSRFNDQERVEIWQKVLSGSYQIVIGVRSAIFLPFEDLGLIVVDEEHDHSFKQSEPNPRYHARDLAVYATRVLNCKTLLGSATPSFESYFNALTRRYKLVEIKNRAVQASLPEIQVVDMRDQRKRKMNNGYFSYPLMTSLEEVIAKKEQGILFQNRRGFVPYLVCQTCGHVPNCINCDISLTFHKHKNELRCHYCGYVDHQTQQCDHCANFTYKLPGVGTEKIEEDLKELYPDARVARMDLDTTRSKHAFRNLIKQFETHQLDFLVGTQMVSKGLDFENVTLVGVVQADNLLNFPDFRAYEHAYQLLTQVSGRAGRSHKKGKVIIQTMMPDNPVLNSLQMDYSTFYKNEMMNREQLDYPPYTRLIRIEVRNRDQGFLEVQAQVLRNLLIPVFGKTLLGPEYPAIARLRNQYRMQFLMKLPRRFSVDKVRKMLREKIDEYYTKAPKKTLRILVDVDPV